MNVLGRIVTLRVAGAPSRINGIIMAVRAAAEPWIGDTLPCCDIQSVVIAVCETMEALVGGGVIDRYHVTQHKENSQVVSIDVLYRLKDNEDSSYFIVDLVKQ